MSSRARFDFPVAPEAPPDSGGLRGSLGWPRERGRSVASLRRGCPDRAASWRTVMGLGIVRARLEDHLEDAPGLFGQTLGDGGRIGRGFGSGQGYRGSRAGQGSLECGIRFLKPSCGLQGHAPSGLTAGLACPRSTALSKSSRARRTSELEEGQAAIDVGRHEAESRQGLRESSTASACLPAARSTVPRLK